MQVTVNADAYTDFNLLFDPEAADIVLTAPWARITAVGNVTNDASMTPELLKRVGETKTPLSDYLVKYAWKGLPLWDEMATAVLVDPSLVTKKVSALMDVNLDHGMDYGRVHVWPDASAPRMGERPVEIVREGRVDRFRAFVQATQFQPKQ